MKVFLAGATGAIGRRLVPMLLAQGHEVVGTTRSASTAAELSLAGVKPVILDPFDAGAVVEAVAEAHPEVVIHQLTALKRMGNLRRFDREFAETNRLRTEALDHLLHAAVVAGARRFIAQSFTGWTNPREGSWVKSEADPLDPDPPAAQAKTLEAIQHLERTVTGAHALEGIALRYGIFYGPGTSIGAGGEYLDALRKRRFPVVGTGRGTWSFTHIDDAARATVLALDRGARGVYNIVDDEPVPVSLWLPHLASVLGYKPPRRVPVWVGRLAVGEVGVSFMTQIRGSSNEKAKRELGFQPRYPSFREGFREGLGDARADASSDSERLAA